MDVPDAERQAGDPKASGRRRRPRRSTPISGSTRNVSTRRSVRACSGSTTRVFISRASRRCSTRSPSADSDAIRLDAFPLAELAQSLGAVDGKHPTAEQLADADVLLSARLHGVWRNHVDGPVAAQRARTVVAHQPARGASRQRARADAFARMISRRDSCACDHRIPGYDSLRVAVERFRELVSRAAGTQFPPESRSSVATLIRRRDSPRCARDSSLKVS